MVRRVFVLMCALVAGSGVPAWAQAPAAGSRVGFRAFGHFEWQNMAAKDSFEAVTGKTRLQGPGVGVEIQRIWRGVFARVALTRMVETGERVFVFNNEAISLGIPLEITMTPIDLAVGWRLTPKTSRGIVPYAGAGMVFLKYKETSDADVSGEAVNEGYKGIVVFGGLEMPVWRFVSLGGEVGWRQVNVPDPGGALEAFNEKDLGGVTMRVMLSVRR